MQDEIQTAGEGTGPMYHRIYAVDLNADYESALKTMHHVMSDPNAFSPQVIARFEKTYGQPDRLCEGDEFMVHLSAPWKGPVRVAHVNENSFSLLTRQGHIEAGRIEFRLVRRGHLSRFEIESVTRSKDQVVNFFYDKIRLAQFAQTEMWELFCKAFAEQAMTPSPKIEVRTERQDRETGRWEDVSHQFGAQGFVI